MLYDFHQRQTSKKPGSVHATYLVDGIPTITKAHSTNGQTGDGEDAYMQNSPVMSSSLPQEETEEYTIPSKSIMLAREEDLQGTQYLKIKVPSCTKEARLRVCLSREVKVCANTFSPYLQFRT